jgi:hypothetical protein
VVAEPVVAPEPALPAPPSKVPSTDELMVLDTISCGVNSAQKLVNCVPRWQALLRTPAAPRWVECTLGDEDIQAHVPRANELWRGRFDAELASEYSVARRCKVGAIEERLSGDQHGIQALTSTLLGEIPTAVDVDAVGLRDELEGGPVWAVIGGESRQVRFLAAYLDDLGSLLAIPGSELVTRDELRAVLDEQFAGDWPGVWVRSAKNFAPQVEDSEQRYGWGYTPIFSVGDGYAHETGPFAVPVQATEGRRYLVMVGTLMRDPDWRALTRRLLIQRIVEDGLAPTPESMAYAAAKRDD